MAKDFEKQKWATEQEALKQKLTDTVNDIITNYEDSPEEIAELLAFKAKFHSYSVSNAILMQKQNPYAAFVASLWAMQLQSWDEEIRMGLAVV